jgi:hypothetical protein
VPHPNKLRMIPSLTNAGLIHSEYQKAEKTARKQMEANLYSPNWVRWVEVSVALSHTSAGLQPPPVPPQPAPTVLPDKTAQESSFSSDSPSLPKPPPTTPPGR